MLVCAVLASLAFGVLAAYAACDLMFRLFRMHVRHATASSSRTPETSTAVI